MKSGSVVVCLQRKQGKHMTQDIHKVQNRIFRFWAVLGFTKSQNKCNDIDGDSRDDRQRRVVRQCPWNESDKGNDEKIDVSLRDIFKTVPQRKQKMMTVNASATPVEIDQIPPPFTTGPKKVTADTMDLISHV